MEVFLPFIRKDAKKYESYQKKLMISQEKYGILYKTAMSREGNRLMAERPSTKMSSKEDKNVWQNGFTYLKKVRPI